MSRNEKHVALRCRIRLRSRSIGVNICFQSDPPTYPSTHGLADRQTNLPTEPPACPNTDRLSNRATDLPTDLRLAFPVDRCISLSFGNKGQGRTVGVHGNSHSQGRHHVRCLRQAARSLGRQRPSVRDCSRGWVLVVYLTTGILFRIFAGGIYIYIYIFFLIVGRR